jgi:glycosyltransferase involved in cell wall biosynthesis
MLSISIVIPALNEAEAIGQVLRSLRARFPEAELIVVNDGSTDNTAQVAADTGAEVLNHDRSRGYGASLCTGMKAAKGKYVLFCDGDGQHGAEDVERLIESCDGYDMVIGARDKESHIPLLRRPGKAILRRFANCLAGEKIPDLNSGLRIVKKDLLMRYIHLMPQGFSFSTTSTFALLKTNHRIKWVPITAKKRVGTSTVRQLKHGPESLLLLLRLTVLFEPLKVFLAVSGVLLVLSLVSLLIDFVLTEGRGIGDTTVLLSIATLIVFLFGLLCDQVSALRRESRE